jgi:hypothetical protein
VLNSTSVGWPNGVRLHVEVAPHVTVWNATGTNNGIAYIDVPTNVPAGGTLQILVQYYAIQPRTVPTPFLLAEPLPFELAQALPPEIIAPSPAAGDSAIRFMTQQGHWYYVQHSSDLTNWITEPNPVCGTGALCSWTVDKSVPARFFRLLVVPQ